MAKINQLDQHTTNLIAAGEVIERAASVVKELVENAIDAQATKIQIKLAEAGLSEIVVSDNGEGMDAQDAKLCVLPHATSKIRNEKDLFKIATLGFRGEALPSIVAVSLFKLKTSADGVRGLMYSLKAGEIVSEAMIAFPKGTEITVRNLFFNTPARLQNLQSASIELGYILDYVSKMALARPNIAFSVINNDRQVLQTFGHNRLLEVITNIYKDEVAKSMIEFFTNNGYFQISGLISKLNITRSSRHHITIIVNGRVVKNNKLVQAVIDAYEERLMGGRYPIAIINIAVDLALVDVNIHPAKLEVRFSSEEELIALLKQEVSQTLAKTNLIVDLSDSKPRENDKIDELSLDEALPPLTETSSQSQEQLLKEPIFIKQTLETDFVKEEAVPAYQLPPLEKIEKTIESFSQQQYTLKDDQIRDDGELKQAHLPLLNYIGQLRGTYLLANDDEYFYIIDQHAAAERINYEKYKRELAKEEIITYEVLVPLVVNFTLSEAILVREHLDDFKKWGLQIEDFGSGSFLVREIPIWTPKGREKDFVEEMIYQLIAGKKTEKEQFLDDLAKTLACKKAIKANEYLEKRQVEYLLEDLSRCENPYTCPHGRPVIVKYSFYDLEKWFKRVV
ncbi:MAG TPA: DNA mismatch repair endonuclease MutL [Bacilli bacterium]|nr:DNA mismatch repair endonuclease MutL [Bacilli bacterium]